MVLDLKILMYRNTDEIEKLKRIKEDSDRETMIAMKQLKDLSESRDSMHQELMELRQVRDAAKKWLRLWRSRKGMKTNSSHWRGGFEKYLNVLKGTSPQPLDSTWGMYSDW